MALPPFFGWLNRSMYGAPVSGGAPAVKALRAITQLAVKVQSGSFTSKGAKPTTKVPKIPKTRGPLG